MNTGATVVVGLVLVYVAVLVLVVGPRRGELPRSVTAGGRAVACGHAHHPSRAGRGAPTPVARVPARSRRAGPCRAPAGAPRPARHDRRGDPRGPTERGRAPRHHEPRRRAHQLRLVGPAPPDRPHAPPGLTSLRSEGDGGADVGAVAGCRVHGDVSADGGYAVADVGQAAALPHGVEVESGAVVLHVEADASLAL